MHFNLNIAQHALLFSLNFLATIPYGAPAIKQTGFMSQTELCNTGAHQSSAINRLTLSQQQRAQSYNKCTAFGGNAFRTQLFAGDIQHVLTIRWTHYSSHAEMSLVVKSFNLWIIMLIVFLIKTKGNPAVVATHYISVNYRCTSHTFYDLIAMLLHTTLLQKRFLNILFYQNTKSNPRTKGT